MTNMIQKYIYFLGFTLIALSCLYFNQSLLLSYDELHAYNIAQNLSPLEIFTVTKSEGHPFLWFYLLMPIAKTSFLFPYSLIILNLLLIEISLYLLYKYAPFPLIIKILITLSAPFLQLYPNYPRSYSLTILLLFLALSLYKNRQEKQLSYLFVLFLLANTNFIGIFLTITFMFALFLENIKEFTKNCKPLFKTIFFGLIEVALLFIQFYNYDTDIPKYTPYNDASLTSFAQNLNQSFAPADYLYFIAITLISIALFIHKKIYFSAFLIIFTNACLILLFTNVYMGKIYHLNFFYIILIASYWLTENNLKETKYFLPLALTAFILIFNPNNRQFGRYDFFIAPIKQSAEVINKNQTNPNTSIIMLEPLTGEILAPYLNRNIILLNQTMTNYRSLKANQEILYPFYKVIDATVMADYVATNPSTTWLYRSCEEETYYNTNLVFSLRHKLNQTYCLYEVSIKN